MEFHDILMLFILCCFSFSTLGDLTRYDTVSISSHLMLIHVVCHSLIMSNLIDHVKPSRSPTISPDKDDS